MDRAVPGGGDAEDDHDDAGSGDPSLSPLPRRREQLVAGACGREPEHHDYLTRPAAQLGLMIMCHCMAREAEEFFAKMGGMRPSCRLLRYSSSRTGTWHFDEGYGT